MAAQQASTPTAAQVGKAFVSQYYNVLHATPHVAHRFYVDGSTVTRAEFGFNGVADTFSTQTEIQQKLVSFKYEECKAEIKTVDSQESLNGSVFVLVTGSLTRNNGKRNFVQSFFLAPQENGYYVLNDIYRYLDDEPQMIKHIYDVPNPGLEMASEIPLDDHHEEEERDLSPSPSPEEVAIGDDAYDIVDNAEVSEPEDLPAADEHDGYEEISEPVTKEPEPVPSEDEPTPASAEDASNDKKSYASIVSYASILLVKKERVVPPKPSAVTLSKQAKVKNEQPPTQQIPSESPSSVQTPSDKVDENTEADTQVEKRSIYVRNLPLDITPAQLEVEFMRFGRIKPNSVNVRSQKQGPCYGFVEFEDPSSAQAAIEASPIYIFGRPAYAEEKRPTSARALISMRGRGSQGRGVFRNDGGRGRGSYGRGFARGIGQNRDFRGWGPGPMRSNYSGQSSNYNNYNGNPSNFNGYRRPDAQGMNVSRPLRRGAGNQMSRNMPAPGA